MSRGQSSVKWVTTGAEKRRERGDNAIHRLKSRDHISQGGQAAKGDWKDNLSRVQSIDRDRGKVYPWRSPGMHLRQKGAEEACLRLCALLLCSFPNTGNAGSSHGASENKLF